MPIRVLSAVRLVVGVVAFLSTAWVFAGTDNASPASDQVKMSDAGVVSLDFQDADIKSVLKVLAFKSGVNIVAAPDVTGVVTIQLNDVPWQKALEVILSTYGYGYERRGNIITVMTVENLKKYRSDSSTLQAQESLISKTFVLSFAKAEDVMKIIEKMKSSRGFMNFDERTNALIVRDLDSTVELIGEVVKSIDTITPQVLIETKVIETDVNNTDNLGIDWVVQASVTGASQPTTFPFIPTGGVLGKGSNSSFFPAAKTFSNFAMPTNSSSSSSSSSTTPTFTYGTINASTFSATLNALSNHQNTKTLSNPRIVTLDNQKATFNVGVEYPLPNYTFNSQTGQQEIDGFTYKPIGINFEVTPHVNNAGLITLDLHPQISAIDQMVTLAPATSTTVAVQIPEINNQETQTRVMVENGKTLVIAGLISDNKVVAKNKVPVLGDIPWLGKLLFTSSNTTVTRTELLIFLTPHVITVDKKPAPDVVQ